MSTSQFVPGNAGMNTFGLATLFLQINIERSFESSISCGIAAVALLSVGKTPSSLPVHSSISSSTVSTSPFMINTPLSFVVPSSVILKLSNNSSAPSASSATMLPCFAAKSVSASRFCAKVKPVLFPNAILQTHAAAPPSLTTEAESTFLLLTPS